MATGTNAITTVRSPRDFRVQGALGVLLVTLGIVTGLLIGGIVWQDKSALVGESQAVIGQVSRLDDYALRHPGASGVADSVSQVGRLDDHALRHPGEVAIQSATQVGEMEDYALRHPGETP